jgi:FAD/FMN-containing dehydrogenase
VRHEEDIMNRRHFVQRSFAAAVGASLPVGSGLGAILSPSMAVDADIEAVTGDGAGVTLKRAAVQELGDSLRGNLLLPGHAAYDNARRVLNASISKYPALIVQPRGVADIRNAVDFARGSNLLVAVKCGGHSHSGKSTCDRGLMIDLSLMRGVHVDPDARVAYVSGGSLLGDMDHETMAFDLATSAGTVSHTGVAGLTLGGGFGRVARRFGLSLDNVRAVDVVTADGRLRHASADENADLYWGVRGGGGNFGVVTSFEFELHPMQREVVGGNITFPFSDARRLLDFYAEYQAGAPDELFLSLALQNGAQGRAVSFNTCYSGPSREAERVLAKVRGAGTPLRDNLRAIDYVALQRAGDVDDPRAIGSYTKSGFSADLTPAFIDAIMSGFVEQPGGSSVFFLYHCGGAINRVAADATAFPHRDITLTPLLAVNWPIESDASKQVAWLRRYWASIEPHIQGFYTNDVIDETQQQVDENYLGNYSRLVALKNKYDPGNLFRLNANVVPTV